MREESFNYRKQLLVIYSWIQQAADELYCLGMNIAMKDELKDFNAILEDGDELPGDISYLKALKDERVVLIVQMIEELFACQNYLVNVNNLSGEDLVSLEDSDNDAGEEESSEETQYVLAAAEVEIYGVCLALIVSIWQLAHQTEEDPQEV